MVWSLARIGLGAFPAGDSVAVFPDSPDDADADSTSSGHCAARPRHTTGNGACRPAPEVYEPRCADDVAPCFGALPPPPVAPCWVARVSRICVEPLRRPRTASAGPKPCAVRAANGIVHHVPEKIRVACGEASRVLTIPSPRHRVLLALHRQIQPRDRIALEHRETHEPVTASTGSSRRSPIRNALEIHVIDDGAGVIDQVTSPEGLSKTAGAGPPGDP